MKIGIITFNSAHNYGAVLQAWALQEYLKGEGHEPSIINYRIHDIDKLYCLFKPRNPFKRAIFNRAVHKAQDVKARFRDVHKYKRYHAFEHFINDTLNTTKPPIYNFGQLQKRKFDFDAMIAGSDQIWNGVFTKMNPGYFLQFGEPEVNRISYAASIGKDEISNAEALQFQKFIKNFDYISVREEKAKEQVKRFSDADVEVVADPTLLLPREKYDEIKKDPQTSQEYIYVHNVHLVKVDERLNAMAEELSNRTGLPIVHNRPDYSFPNELEKFLDGGPEEFIGWIANARYVIANSFHATVFSMIYHKEFITIPHFQNPDRMKFFLNSLGIGNHLLAVPNELPDDLSKLAIDYEKVEEKKRKMRDRSKVFLKHALENKKVNDEKKKRSTYFDYPDPYKCYGCRACQQICPTNAIKMKQDELGFIYPEINDEQCIYCDDCKRVCIYENPSLFYNKEDSSKIKIYSAYHADEEVRKESSSGGVFTEFCRKAMEEKGIAAGVLWNQDNSAVYQLASTIEECELFRGVKYVAADNEAIKPEVKKMLNEGKFVLYSGTPCEIAGLRSYLLKDYDNLLTVDVMCSGMAAPAVLKNYLKEIEAKYHSPIESIKFDDKFRGKKKGYFIITFRSGEIHLEEVRKNNYMNHYKKGNLQRPACYTCEFMKGTKSVSDITLGRFQKASVYCEKMDDEFGTSFVQINTEKGKAFFQKVKDNMTTEEYNNETLPGFCEKSPIRLTMQRSRLAEKLGEMDTISALNSFRPARKRRKRR